MQYEVELKFPVADMRAIEGRSYCPGGNHLPRAAGGAGFLLCHPLRDFAVTDEALRLRQKGSKGYITYKGPEVGRRHQDAA